MRKRGKEKEPSIFRQEMKRDWNTFKNLKGFKKKLGFLWDYYKLPVTLLVTLLVFVCIFAHMLWEGQKPRIAGLRRPEHRRQLHLLVSPV